ANSWGRKSVKVKVIQ
ncbi:hypothetical protein, partial [Bacillus toyonensis]